jgi:N-acetylglucosaminyl-diphospho-decaprenol L-rhamnosyltransferase
MGAAVTPRVGVAVVSWNTRELLADCLESLRPDVEAGLATVCVVDNASTDGSAQMVEERFPGVRLIASRENLGFGPAVNLAAGQMDEPWIAPANADVAVTPGALASLLAAGDAAARAGAVAPRLVMPDGGTQHSVHPFPTPGLGVAFNLGLARLIPGLGDRLCLEGHWDASRPRAVDWAHGAFLVVRREAFEQVGGFDPDQWMYAEDLDLCWRLRQAGWLTLYEPAAVVQHEVSAATRQAFDEERDRRHIEAAYRWMAGRQGRAAATAYAAVNWLGSAVRWLALTPLARARPQVYAARRARLRRYAGFHWRGLCARALPRGERSAP